MGNIDLHFPPSKFKKIKALQKTPQTEIILKVLTLFNNTALGSSTVTIKMKNNTFLFIIIYKTNILYTNGGSYMTPYSKTYTSNLIEYGNNKVIPDS